MKMAKFNENLADGLAIRRSLSGSVLKRGQRPSLRRNGTNVTRCRFAEMYRRLELELSKIYQTALRHGKTSDTVNVFGCTHAIHRAKPWPNCHFLWSFPADSFHPDVG